MNESFPTFVSLLYLLSHGPSLTFPFQMGENSNAKKKSFPSPNPMLSGNLQAEFQSWPYGHSLLVSYPPCYSYHPSPKKLLFTADRATTGKYNWTQYRDEWKPRSPTSPKTSASQLLCLWLKGHNERGGKKILRARLSKSQTIRNSAVKQVSFRDGCIHKTATMGQHQ